MDTPRPSPRTNRTRRVLHPVLIGHAASFTSQAATPRGARASTGAASSTASASACGRPPPPPSATLSSLPALRTKVWVQDRPPAGGMRAGAARRAQRQTPARAQRRGDGPSLQGNPCSSPPKAANKSRGPRRRSTGLTGAAGLTRNGPRRRALSGRGGRRTGSGSRRSSASSTRTTTACSRAPRRAPRPTGYFYFNQTCAQMGRGVSS